MLILTRKLGEQVTIGEDCVLTILSVIGTRVKLGFKAPDSLRIRLKKGEESNENPSDSQSTEAGETDPRS